MGNGSLARDIRQDFAPHVAQAMCEVQGVLAHIQHTTKCDQSSVLTPYPQTTRGKDMETIAIIGKDGWIREQFRDGERESVPNPVSPSNVWNATRGKRVYDESCDPPEYRNN